MSFFAHVYIKKTALIIVQTIFHVQETVTASKWKAFYYAIKPLHHTRTGSYMPNGYI